ncbi:fungal-specific transcription factor domain-containing protein [Aspergillus granulosus]|uniref:Fungal-specific transcription factor domain-containing protein n=1 Tax=Aspergillus granulosus TaxID=176169 RepID=A0ABR4GU99_9EURO
MRRVKKSRNGCARCKSKRVKCGEEKPHCSRCTRLGVKCPGYIQTLRWVTNNPPTGEDGGLETATDNDSIDFNAHIDARKASQSSRPRSQPTAEHYLSPEHAAPLALGMINAPDHSDLGVVDDDDASGLCDELWDLQQPAPLPELEDLCPQSPASARSAANHHAPGSALNFGSPASLGSDPLAFFSLAAPILQNQSRDFPGFDPSTIVRQYPPPSAGPGRPAPRDLTSIPQPLNNPSWTLIEYYFKEVAALFSSYDSQMNPFRTTVSRLWGSSLAMCRTMQSMAAATLVNDFPQFGPMGKKMRNEAIEIISNETTMDDKSLLALLMLGQTASWHDPKDLGISFFNLLRRHLDTAALTKSTNPTNRGNNYQFFEEALVYWEMLLSFVADDATVLPAAPAPSNTAESLVLQRVPHPWTGIARDTQFTVQEAGRLVRAERKRIRARKFTSQADIAQAQIALERARELEERLLSLAHPTEAEIVSPGDDETPVWHLLTMAEVYRCTGLLQLYRAFPDLLQRRLPLQQQQQQQHHNSPNQPHPTHSPSHHNTFTQPLDPSTSWFTEAPYPPSQHPPHPTTSSPSPNPPPDATYYDSWLTEFALTTLSRLKTIPQESRTRCLQPLLLVTSSSELRLPPQPPLNPDPNGVTDANEPSLSGNGPCISSHALEVSRTRRFVLGRLTSFLHVLPPKPISVCLQLVNEVWRRMDSGDTEVYWMDVMIEKGWETTMG